MMYLFVGNGWVFSDKLFVATIYVFEGNKVTVFVFFPNYTKFVILAGNAYTGESKDIPVKNYL